MVGWRNPARYLAPLALAAVAVAAYVIIHHALAPKPAPRPALVQTTNTSSSQTVAGHHGRPKAKFYTVQQGDTLSRIAARTGVSLTTLETLNPSINPDALHVSQRLRLR